MNQRIDAGRLLDQHDVLRYPRDLDLLVFFARHPRTILSSDQIAAFLGYGTNDIASSLELLLEAGFVTRTPHPRHAARMYVLAATPPGGEWLPALRNLAATREGRLALIREIRRRSSEALSRSTQENQSANGTRPLPFRRVGLPPSIARRATRRFDRRVERVADTITDGVERDDTKC